MVFPGQGFHKHNIKSIENHVHENQDVPYGMIPAGLHIPAIKHKDKSTGRAHGDSACFDPGQLFADNKTCKNQDKYGVQHMDQGCIHRVGKVQPFVKERLV